MEVEDLDTLIVKNNIAELDSSTSDIMVFNNGLTTIGYMDIDYNQYFINTRAIRMDIDSASIWSYKYWADWQSLGYDIHSDKGAVAFTNKWGSTVSDYKLISGSNGIDKGTDISIFNTDILSELRPKSAAWDRGAFEQ